jgi:hypothetical protein
MSTTKKYILYAYIKPYDIKLCLIFPIDSKIRFVQEYIDDTMRNFRTRYKVGRIEHKKTSSILLPDFKIGDILEDKDELIVYSIEYGLTKKTLNNKNSIEDIDKLFIAKKTRRDSRAVSRKISIDKNERKTKGNKDNNDDDDDEEDDDKNEQNEEEEQYDNNEENVEEKNNEQNDDNENSESEDKKNNMQKKKGKKIEKNDDSSNSGDDKSEDLKL